MYNRKITCGIVGALLACVAQGAVTQVSISSGESIVIANSNNNDQVELTAAAGSTIVMPPNGIVFTRVRLTGSGTVTLAPPAPDFSEETAIMANGLAAADETTLHVSAPSVTALKVGKTIKDSSDTAVH